MFFKAKKRENCGIWHATILIRHLETFTPEKKLPENFSRDIIKYKMYT